MIKIPTVLILRAGSSNQLGYPLGRSLISELCQQPQSPNDDDLLFGRWKSSEIKELIKGLSRGVYDSIDAFLEEQPKHLELGRFLIARQLKQHEEVDRLFLPHDSGWYRYLFSKLIEDDKHADRIGENALSIITFNYDRSLECFLHEAIQSRCHLSSDESAERLKLIQIIHPHGILGAYPQIPYGKEASADELSEIARGIKIIHELEHAGTGYCAPEFETANELLRKAERILFLGFGFHADNMRRFNFFKLDALKGKEVKGTVLGLGSADLNDLITRLEMFGIQRDMLNGNGCDGFFSHVTRLR